jgi:anaerobic ribonucleoside-triphosphate reductase activating protein
MLNGDGLRVVLWVSGCDHGCPGCQNQITWDPADGVEFDTKAKEEVRAELAKSYINGITFSGGDPLFPSNIAPITSFAKEIKKDFPNKTIWLYTGSLYEDVKNYEVMNYVDVLVDGEFIESRLDTNLHWKGSDNQRVIDVPNSKKLDEIVLHG